MDMSSSYTTRCNLGYIKLSTINKILQRTTLYTWYISSNNHKRINSEKNRRYFHSNFTTQHVGIIEIFL